MSKKLNLTGQRFGRLLALEIGEGHVWRDRRITNWKCVCDCGITKVVRTGCLISGNTKSCGCLSLESKKTVRHGLSHSRTYKSWSGMWTRCRGKKHYADRGITVCERWKLFENFLADMGERPPNLSIERIDNNGNYCPENCKWATQKEQTFNRRVTLLATINGITKPAIEWADGCGVNRKAFYYRLSRGWPIERALLPVKK